MAQLEWLHLVPVILSYYTLIRQDFYKFAIVGVCAFVWPWVQKVWSRYWSRSKILEISEFNECGTENETYKFVAHFICTKYPEQIQHMLTKESHNLTTPINGLSHSRFHEFGGSIDIEFQNTKIEIKKYSEERKIRGGTIDGGNLMIFAPSFKIIDAFVDDCQRFSLIDTRTKLNTGKIAFYYDGSRRQGIWVQREITVNKTFDNVLLHADDRTRLLKILNCFKSNQFRLYNHKWGMSNKFGLLFHGTPGGGKTSTILAISNYTKLPLYLVHFDINTGIQTLREMVYKIPNRCILVLEDIDCCKALHDRTRYKGKNAISDTGMLKFMLEFLDGYSCLLESLVIMTANYPDKLDRALIRPGRIDFQFEFQSVAPIEMSKALGRTQMTTDISSCEMMNDHRMSCLLK